MTPSPELADAIDKARREALEEALASIPDAHNASTSVFRSRVLTAIRYLLAADHREADAWMLADDTPPAKSYEDGIRDALAALPDLATENGDVFTKGRMLAHNDALRAAHAAISALLPQTGYRAQQLVSKWRCSIEDDFDPIGDCWTMNFARWLIDQGLVREGV